MYVNPKLVKQVISYASIIMAVLTQALSGIHLSPTASAILGVFGVLLHPDTSIVSTSGSATNTVPQQQAQSASTKLGGL
jgi:hypothetical protein